MHRSRPRVARHRSARHRPFGALVALAALVSSALVPSALAVTAPAVSAPAVTAPAAQPAVAWAQAAPAYAQASAADVRTEVRTDARTNARTNAPFTLATPLAARELGRVTGGTCTSCSDDSSGSGGGGGGGTGSSGSPTARGTPYWETYRVTLDSTYETPAALVSKINNWSNLIISGTYEYTRTVVRDVKFSGGFASFVSASVGGEVRQSTTARVTYPIPPRSFGKLYVKYRTERRTYYGRQYQPMNDGSRTVVGSASGPYESTSTVLGYVTGAL